MILILSSDLFDDQHPFTAAIAEVFVDAVEKILGAKPGTMGFIRALLHSPESI